MLGYTLTINLWKKDYFCPWKRVKEEIYEYIFLDNETFFKDNENDLNNWYKARDSKKLIVKI